MVGHYQAIIGVINGGLKGLKETHRNDPLKQSQIEERDKGEKDYLTILFTNL